MIHREKLKNTLNCLQVKDYECNECGYGFLSADKPANEMQCPSCSGMLEASPTFIINRGECNHNRQAHGHQYIPRV